MQEQAWFLDLTDIILSRLGTRVLLNLHHKEHQSWDAQHLRHMIRAADKFESNRRMVSLSLKRSCSFTLPLSLLELLNGSLNGVNF
jgi:hypothetical protein